MSNKILPHHLQQLPKIPLHKVSANKPIKNTSFSTLLQQEIKKDPELKISKHAEKRMEQRGISFEPALWQKIEVKLEEAKNKGIHDSLVITDTATLVVSTKNNTVITVLDREEAQSQIFTNINGAILL